MLKPKLNLAIDVPFVDLSRQYIAHRDEILKTIDEVLSSGNYILGGYVERFEADIADYLGCEYVLGVANGTDAIILALKSFGVGLGDEVILPVNSFLATAGAVAAVGATPILCDVTDDLNIDVKKVADLVTKKTKAIIPVHLTGRVAEMDAIMKIANDHKLYVIEDAAQSIGAKYKGKMSGTIGHVGCFSLHPLKNLHVYGDGGLMATNDEALYQDLKLIRNHGLKNRDTCLRWGLNSRLDSLQAAIGCVNLKYLDSWNAKRRNVASQYQSKLSQYVKVPVDKAHEYQVYHNFVIQTEKRDQLQAYLADNGVETKIHYPIQIHEQPAAKAFGYKQGDFPIAERLAKQMMSLPVYSELREDELERIIRCMLAFLS